MLDVSEYDDDSDDDGDGNGDAVYDDDDDINVADNRNPLVVLTATLRRCVRLPAHKYHRGEFLKIKDKLKLLTNTTGRNFSKLQTN